MTIASAATHITSAMSSRKFCVTKAISRFHLFLLQKEKASQRNPQGSPLRVSPGLDRIVHLVMWITKSREGQHWFCATPATVSECQPKELQKSATWANLKTCRGFPRSAWNGSRAP